MASAGFGRGGRVRDTALVCENGHRLAGHAEELSAIPRFCQRCGDQTLLACPRCKSRIPGDAPHVRVLMDKPPPAYCGECGEAYPWRAAALERLRRVTAMQKELHSLDDATAAELSNFAADVTAGRATPERARTFGHWFTKKTGVESAKGIGAVFKDVATSVLADVIKKTMMGA